ncbi:MAG: hypothetical protein KCHDKBKB_01335 [Elusimicrobia bacterium]|nr:hypothetical protein [Elusimicrobiota bacterium]
MKKWIVSISIVLIGWAGVAVIGAADKTGFPPNENGSDAIATVDVQLDGQPLFRVRGMSGFSAEKRAKAIESRIKTAAKNVAVSSASINVVERVDRTDLVAGEMFIASLLDADAETENIPRSIMAERARINIVNAIARYRHDRSSKILLRRTFVALAATVGFIFLLFGIGKIYRWLLVVAERNVKTRMDSLEARSSHVIESRPLWTAIVGILSALRVITVAVLIYFYLNLVLGLFPWTRPVAVQLFSIFIAPLRTLGHKFIAALPDLAFLVVFTIIIRYVLKITRLFFAGIDHKTIQFKDFDPELAWPTYRITRFLIICFAVVVAYPYIPGSNSDAFKGVSLFIGVLFSLGSTSLIANLVASIALTYRRAFRVGDIIKVTDVMGLVTEMRMQATHLRTLHNETIVIPNSIIVNSHVINFSTLAKNGGLVLHTTVGIGYETPWRQVQALLLMAADRTSGLLKDRKPFVRQLALDTFCVQYELGVYCDAPLDMPWVYTNLHKNILDVFNEYGVQIMTPAYEGDPQTPKIVPKDQVHAAPADKLNA